MKNYSIKPMVVICVIILVSATVFPKNSDATAKIILVGTTEIKESVYGKWLTLTLTEVFRRLGYEVQFKGYPTARASEFSDTGQVDGEMCRVFEYQRTHPNLIRVNEAHSSSKFVAFAVKPGIVLQGWESLKDTAYKVEYRRGSEMLEKKLSLVVAPKYLSSIRTIEQGLKKLIAKRTDLYVDGELITIEALKRLKSDQLDVSTVYQAGTIQKIGLYLYLHKKHAVLVSKVAETIKAMKQEGVLTYGGQK